MKLPVPDGPTGLNSQPAAIALPQGSAARLAGGRYRHIIDILIKERAPKTAANPFWSVLRPSLYALLHYAKARRMADAIAPMNGHDAMDFISRLLDLRVASSRLDRIPAAGPVMVISNHPTGIADGVAVFDALKAHRPDICFYANSDAHRVCPNFGDVLIPVEWVKEKRTRERTRLTLKMTGEALDQSRLLMIFPAGRLARKFNGVLRDPEWQSSAVSIARKYSVPVAPCHLKGPYAFLFHFFDKFSKELRDITLFHELLNKSGSRYDLQVGPLIPPEHMNGDPVEQTRRLKYYIERILPLEPDRPFDPKGPMDLETLDSPKPGQRELETNTAP